MRTGVSLILLAVVGSSCGQVDARPADGLALNPAPVPPGPASYEANCTQPIAHCQWAIASCLGDPTCAHWYDCIRRCSIGDLQRCAVGCDASSAQNAARTQASVCLFGTSGVRACGPQDTGLVGTGGAGGTEIGKGDDGGIHPTWNSPDKCGDCATTRCCPEADADGSPCSAYIDVIKGCIDPALRADGGLEDPEECLLAAEQPAADAADAGWEQNAQDHAQFVTSGAMACVYSTCAVDCFPDPYLACVKCLENNCVDQLNAVLTDVAAQDYLWCWKCKTDKGPNCPSDCSKYGEDAALLVGDLLGCRTLRCGRDCP
jgi:hypothetical protein